MTTLADRRAADIALTVGAVLGSLCLLATALAVVTGLRPVIFETGSMSPAISTGSLGLSRTVPAADVHRGDVVGVTRPDGTRVTHRVESVDGRLGDSVTLTLKGDGNTVTDVRPYAVTEVDRVYATVPGLGYVAMWLKNPYTIALEALVLLGLLAVAFAPRDGWRASPVGRRVILGTAAASVAVVTTSGLPAGDADADPFTARATATGTVHAGRPAPAPKATCKNYGGVIGLLGGAADIAISNPVPARGLYSYELRIVGQAGVVATVPASNSDPSTIRVSVGLLSALLGTLTGNSGPWSIQILSKVDTFYSVSGPTVPIRVALLPLLSIQCNPEGTYEGPQVPSALSAVPGSSTSTFASRPSTPAASTPTSSTSTPVTSTPVTSSPVTSSPVTSSPESPSQTPPQSSASPVPAVPELPEGGTVSDSGRFAFYLDGGSLIVRNTTDATIVYRDAVATDSTAAWTPGTDDLIVSAPDGSVTTISDSGGRWVAVVTEPQPSPAPATSESTPSPIR